MQGKLKFKYVTNQCSLYYVVLLHVYVKTPTLQVMYGKYSTRGGVEWQMQHKAKLSAVFAQDPT